MYKAYNIYVYINIICMILYYIIYYIYTYILVRCPLQRTESGGRSAWVLEGRSGSNELPIFSDWQWFSQERHRVSVVNNHSLNCLKQLNHRKTIGKWWFNEALWWFRKDPPFFNEKIHYKWPFSIATLNYQRVLADFIRLIHQQFKVAYCEGNLGITMKSEGVGITRQSRYITKQNRGRTVEAGS